MAGRAPRPRGSYRHGDLRNALVAAGTALARAGGPEAVVLREATRRAGVAPNAAYRHFADRAALLGAVRGAAETVLATAMADALDAASAGGGDPARDPALARARLTALGTAYLHFARAEPGLFRTAFGTGVGPDDAGATGPTPFGLLSRALDDLVAAGALDAARRPHAALAAWSAVHGLAMLAVQGPLDRLPPDEIAAVSAHLLDVVQRGL